MNMRSQFVQTVEGLLAKDSKMVILLGDIGVYGFRNSFQNYPERIFNIGILEQSTIGLAAGFSKVGFIPVVHTIAPFLVERAYEQLKDDFGYQRLGGNFVSVGASYDYAALGCTHHSPADVGILKMIPGMEIIIPGTSSEFDRLFNQSYQNGQPTYFRLSERENGQSFKVKAGKAVVVKKGTKATVIAVGPTLDKIIQAAKNIDLTILYYTTVSPFDSKTLKRNCPSGKILLCEPYYQGVLSAEVCQALNPRRILIETMGVPHQFLTNYGKDSDQDQFIGWTVEQIRKQLIRLIRRTV